MWYQFTNANVYRNGDIRKETVAVCDRILFAGPADRPLTEEIASDRYTIFPGFTDVHVHLREPGFSYKETIASGSRAAARGGYPFAGYLAQCSHEASELGPDL